MNTTFKSGILYNGDCLEVMKNIPDNSVDMILCDLPYGTTQNKWDTIIPFDMLWQQYWRVCKDTTPIILTSAQPFTSLVVTSQLKNFKYNWTWVKNTASGHLNAKKQPMRNTEDILCFYKKQCTYNPIMEKGAHIKMTKNITNASDNYGKQVATTYESNERYPKQILNFDIPPNSKGKLHPTQKPVELFEYLIRTYTNAGNIVLDSCSGSGTTAVAAIQTKRKWICIEKDKTYYDKSCERIEITERNQSIFILE